MARISYDTEFMYLMLKRLAKRTCPHCHERGYAGLRPGTDTPVACQCAVQNIVKYRRLRKPKAEMTLRLTPEVRLAAYGGRMRHARP